MKKNENKDRSGKRKYINEYWLKWEKNTIGKIWTASRASD